RILFTIINFDFDEINCVAYGTVAENLYKIGFHQLKRLLFVY
ncbi:unnamed protein product, partial [Brassica oleracea]